MGCDLILKKYGTQEDLAHSAMDADAAIIRSDIVDKQVIDRAQELRLIVRAGSGIDNVDTAYAATRGIIVENTPGQNSNAVAEMIFHMIHQGFRPMNGRQGRELAGKTLAIHGFGNIGSLVARLGSAYRMDVRAFDVNMDYGLAGKMGVEAVETAADLYRDADIVTLNIPSTKDTRDSIGIGLLGLLKEDAIVINTARHDIIRYDELDRLLALRQETLYMTDVPPESGNGTSGLFSDMRERYQDRIFCTPKKMGAQTEEANMNAAIAAARQVVMYLRQGRVENCVNGL